MRAIPALRAILRQSACAILFAGCASSQTQVTLSTVVTPAAGVVEEARRAGADWKLESVENLSIYWAQ